MKGEGAFYIVESMLNLALCSTVIPEEDETAFKGLRLNIIINL
jgi:hypothetical protein